MLSVPGQVQSVEIPLREDHQSPTGERIPNLLLERGPPISNWKEDPQYPTEERTTNLQVERGSPIFYWREDHQSPAE